jgi:hypothetical protein
MGGLTPNSVTSRWWLPGIGGMLAVALWAVLPFGVLKCDEPATKKPGMDATTLHHKVLCGYQGWFRCPGDPADEGWKHWSRNLKKIAADTVTFEMWPDVTEFTDEEKYPAPGFTYPDGKPAHLFSSAHPKTVERHFQWMEQYGIDGVFVQRFVVNIANPSSDRVLQNVRASFATAADLGVEMAYVAMFHEVDEATAVFKVSNSPPTQARFETYDGLPSDWYLRLTGEGSKVIRGERKNQVTLPITP